MKDVNWVCLGVVLLSVIGVPAEDAVEFPVTLHLEKAEALPGPWETVPLDSMAMTPDGGTVDEWFPRWDNLHDRH